MYPINGERRKLLIGAVLDQRVYFHICMISARKPKYLYILLIFLISVLCIYSNTWSTDTEWRAKWEIKTYCRNFFKVNISELKQSKEKVLFVQNFNRIKIKIKNIDREETGENVSESWSEDRWGKRYLFIWNSRNIKC